jgi:hypothetical protein
MGRKVIIAGGKDYADAETLRKAASRFISREDTIISGTAKGADTLGEEFAERNGLPLERYPADWERLGRGAGYSRNHQMCQIADAALFFWNGRSKGTKHCIEEAHKARLTTMVVYYDEVPTQGKIKGSGEK